MSDLCDNAVGLVVSVASVLSVKFDALIYWYHKTVDELSRLTGEVVGSSFSYIYTDDLDINEQPRSQDFLAGKGLIAKVDIWTRLIKGCSFSSQNTLWLCLGDIALLSVLTIILCVRLAKHLRRAKTGEDFYSEEPGSSNYGVPTRLFHSFSKLNRKRFTMPWYVIIIWRA